LETEGLRRGVEGERLICRIEEKTIHILIKCAEIQSGESNL
jgi:hypothetical protein